jgi:4-amino-4-deoxy-L-arabinose transferase-like glycosyltransferase
MALHSSAASTTSDSGVAPALVALERLALIVGAALVLFLAFYNLTDFPLTWFDEGSHLHVPKTLVRYGVYADYSSDGFRHYGPTVGVGPTVMLPVALAFQLFGIGLLQARVVMALYLLAAIAAGFFLARRLGGPRLAWVATALLVVTPGIDLLEYGRQVLGEVPGLFFTLAGFLVWFTAWEKARLLRLLAAGLLFGLAMVTKNQYLLILAPTLLFAWVANLLYYRSAPQRVFLLPGMVAAACFAIWQAILVLYLGPSTLSENLALLRESTAGAALVFSPDLMRRALIELLSAKVFLWALPLILAYGVTTALPRRREGHQWGVLFFLVVFNLLWYVVASISWLRYAFPALAVGCLFVARFLHDLTQDFRPDVRQGWQALRFGEWRRGARRVGAVLGLAWLSLALSLSFVRVARDIVFPPFNAPLATAEYLNAHVPLSARIETWEAELPFLTDHVYSSPPAAVLPKAVSFVWQGGPPPAQFYDFEANQPDYVVVGALADWVGIYPAEKLNANYQLVTTIGSYRLYQLRR